MAKFEISFEATMKNEGFYSDHPSDPGGETYLGIARNLEPGKSWIGWKTIDGCKTLDKPIGENERRFLRPLVQTFYHDEYWVKSGAIHIDSQLIANELFDTAVNLGYVRAVRILQEALNKLNRRQVSYPNIAVDGLFGGATQQTVKVCLEKEKDNEKNLYTTMNLLQGCYYASKPEDSSEEDFWRGHLERAQAKGILNSNARAMT